MGELYDELRAAPRKGPKRKPALRLAKPDDGSDPRPIIRISTRLDQNTDDAIESLRADGTLYQKDGALVHVVRVAEADQVKGFVAGMPHVRKIEQPNLRERLARAARWERYDGRSGEWLSSLPSPHVTAAVASRGEWGDAVRPLVGVVETPFLRADGSIADQPGYDAATGFLLEDGCELASIPPMVTRAMAETALAELREVFEEFPFEREAGRMAAVAAVLTLLARPAIKGPTPAFVLDKNTSGTGGTLATDAITIITTGRNAPRLSWPPDDIELEKVLGSLALGAARLVGFDNVTTAFRGGPLDKVLTAEDRVQLRVLGVSEVPSLQWRAVVIASGNNVEIAGDTVRRVLAARIVSPLERPEERSDLKRPDLRAFVREHRARLVRAALVVLRGFVCAGRPDQGLRKWGSFEAWAELVPAAVVYAGGADPMGARLSDGDRIDPERGAFLTLLRELRRFAPSGTTLKDMVGHLYPLDRLRGECAPDGWESLRNALETFAPPAPGKAPDLRKLGYRLREHRDRVAGGLRLTSSANRDGTQVWRSETAGDAGDAGDVSNPTRGNCQDRSKGRDREHAPHAPHHPHVGGSSSYASEDAS